MPAVALCDGASSSLKAVEFAGFPNFFVRCTDQLLLVHAWNPTRLLLFGGASAAQAVKDGANAATSVPSSPAVSGMMAAASSGYQEAMRVAIASVSPEVVELQRQCLPVPYVLNAHISAIKESKALKDVLNYKLETANVPLPVTPETSKADEEGRGGKKTGQRASGSKGTKEEITPLKIQEPTAEEIAANAASLTADYTRQRAVHHKAETIFLGVGNLMDGKAIKLGNTAEAVLRELKEKFYLYFIKNDGFTLRHTTSLIRYVVIVTVENGSPPPPPPPPPETEVVEGGKSDEKNEKGEKKHSADAESNPNSYRSGHIRPDKATSAPSMQLSNGAPVVIAEPEAESPVKPVDAIKDGLNAVRYALSRRRHGHKDAVAVLLVVEPHMSEEVIHTYRTTFEEEIANAPDVSGAKEVAEQTVAETPAPVTGTDAEAAEGAKLDEAWPPVSLITFKASKHVPQPTVWDSSQQLIKGLQQKKLEFAVIASSAPPPVMKTVLCHNKPHVILVPPSNRFDDEMEKK